VGFVSDAQGATLGWVQVFGLGISNYIFLSTKETLDNSLSCISLSYLLFVLPLGHTPLNQWIEREWKVTRRSRWRSRFLILKEHPLGASNK
jgi:hypothetical protein